MPRQYKYLYGPVPSRRLGRSLGIDIVPLKVCTLDCVYCQLGRSSEKTTRRREYVPIDAVIEELAEKISSGLDADFITIAGSGEPTLNSGLGKLLKAASDITDIPLTVLTNGTLFYREDVRADCAQADVVMPSLDAGDEPTFRKINRPHRDISIEKLVSGLRAFREEFAGRIWLEVFLVDDINTDTEQVAKIKGLIERIRPDKIHLNTAVRPTADANVKKVAIEKLHTIAAALGESCEVIADFSARHQLRHAETTPQDVFSMLKRRPCSLRDISAGLGISSSLAVKHLASLQRQGLVESYQKNRTVFFKAT
jgi:wyosine [tRNA(Phe)-imidazoG37] synthetase (radical SAM superfamily)